MHMNKRMSVALLTGGLILASCGGNANQDLLEATITSTPTIAVKSDGQTLELGFRQIVEGTITLIRTIYAFGEDEDYPIALTWSVAESANQYFNFREGTIDGVSVFNVSIIQPSFGTAAVDVSLNLLATMTVGTTAYTTTREYLLTINPEAVDSSLIPLIPLSTDFTRNADLSYVNEVLQNASRSVRNAAIVRVRGYVSGIFTDWNTSYITSGEYGLALFRTDLGYIDAFGIGDYIEVTGEAATFNGSRQIAWITSIKILPPIGDEPVIRQLTAANFASTSIANNGQRFRDGSIVRLAQLQFDSVTSGAPVSGPLIGVGNHLSLRFKVFDGNTSYNVNAYLNYRLGVTKREAIYDLLIQAPVGSDQFLTFQGVLGWSFGPQLMILELSDFSIQ
jgi:hypothetical protein